MTQRSVGGSPALSPFFWSFPHRALRPQDPAVPARVRAQALAGALFVLLRWWIEHDGPRRTATLGQKGKGP